MIRLLSISAYHRRNLCLNFRAIAVIHFLVRLSQCHGCPRTLNPIHPHDLVSPRPSAREPAAPLVATREVPVAPAPKKGRPRVRSVLVTASVTTQRRRGEEQQFHPSTKLSRATTTTTITTTTAMTNSIRGSRSRGGGTCRSKSSSGGGSSRTRPPPPEQRDVRLM